MNIVLCTDHKFVMPCGIAICSICVNNEDSFIHFYIITDDSITQKDKKDLEYTAHVHDHKNDVTFLFVNENMVSAFSWYKSGYYPKQIFYRLLMTELLPDNIDKVLYLDCDIIVRKSLSSLWNIELGDNYIGAAPDGFSGILYTYNRLKYSITLGYFNSGVMLVNVFLWKKRYVLKRLIEYMDKNKIRIILGDQDPMNFLFKDNKVHIPLTYNVQPSYLYLEKYMQMSIYQFKEELEEARHDPAILHYAGCRPWEKGCKHPFKNIFGKYKDMTIWKNEISREVKKTFKIKILSLLKYILIWFGICHQIDYFDKGLHLD